LKEPGLGGWVSDACMLGITSLRKKNFVVLSLFAIFAEFYSIPPIFNGWW
jgi:hypothetical protein